jgi:hypothetical protein
MRLIVHSHRKLEQERKEIAVRPGRASNVAMADRRQGLSKTTAAMDKHHK